MKYTFDQIAYNITKKKQPVDSDREFYIGLEHIDPETFTISRWGSDITPAGEKLLISKGDILFGKRRAYQRKVAIAPFDGIFSAHGMVLRPKEDVINPDFFPFFIASDQFMETAVRISVGGLSPTINWKDLKNQEFELPPIEDQEVLADKLWAAYRLKEAYKRLLSATDEMVKSQFIEMFGKDQYAFVKLPDISENLDSMRIPITSGNREPGEFPYYGASGIVDYVKDYIFNESLLLISEDGANLKDRVSDIAFIADGKYWVNNHAHIIRIKNPIIQNYICYFFNYTNVEKFLTGMAQPKLNQAQLNSIPIPWPPIELQKRFAEIVRQADKSKYYVQNKLNYICHILTKQIPLRRCS